MKSTDVRRSTERRLGQIATIGVDTPHARILELQMLAEIAVQLAEANEARTRIDTFSFAGTEFRRDAIQSVGAVQPNGWYNVEMPTESGSYAFKNDDNPRADFIRAWKGE